MILFVYIIAINALSFWLMRDDKQRAKDGKRRIPERVLFEVALIGGSFGGTIAMHRYRHKTKHWYFAFGFPFLLCFHLLLIFLVFFL